MYLEDYTKIIETVYHQKELGGDTIAPNVVMLLILIFFSGVYYFIRSVDNSKTIRLYDLLLIPIILAFIGTVVPTKVINRSVVLSHNYEYTINTEKHDEIDDYGVNRRHLDQVSLSFKNDYLLPKQIKTYENSLFDFEDRGNHDWIVGTVGKKGITLVEKEYPSYDEVELEEIRENYAHNNYVIIAKEQLGDDYDVIVEKMKTIHGENYSNPYQVKYPSNNE